MTAQIAFLPAVLRARLNAHSSQVADFCQRWEIQELALFGSVIRDDFSSSSDIDVLIECSPTASSRLFDKVHAQAELSQLFGRPVDLTRKGLLKNPFSKAEILQTHRVIYPSEKGNFTGLIAANTLMTDNVRNHAALFDMVQAMQAIGRFVSGKAFEAYLSDEMLQGAVERKLEILGEAANRTTVNFQSQHPEIDWSIIGLRNVIIHQYDELDYKNVWAIATNDVPLLLEKVQPLVPDLPTENSPSDN